MSKTSNIFMIKGKNNNDFVQMPEPKLGGVVVTDEPIWAANTGRSSTGKMIGDIVDWKTTIEVSWPPLTFADAKTLRDAIRNAGEFFQIRYRDIESGNTVSNMTTTKWVYAGNVPRALRSLATIPMPQGVDGDTTRLQRYDGITVTFIEQ